MILIPEIETVLILTPRAASSSLKRAVLARYSKAMMLYRHMEADGVPHGYDRWRRIGVIRHPVARLWSLYKYLQNFDGPYPAPYIAAQRASVAMPFDKWLVCNKVVFTNPYDTAGIKFFPAYAVLHSLPENRKSQYFYLRPDLGTIIYPFERLHIIADLLDVTLERANETYVQEPPRLDLEANKHMSVFHQWDYITGAYPMPKGLT